MTEREIVAILGRCEPGLRILCQCPQCDAILSYTESGCVSCRHCPDIEPVLSEDFYHRIRQSDIRLAKILIGANTIFTEERGMIKP